MPVNRIVVLPYGPSDSATALVNTLRERGFTSNKLRTQGSTFRGRPGDLVVNWGNSTINAEAMNRITNGNDILLNNPTHLEKASNKLKAFQAMELAGVRLVEWTSDIGVANNWVQDDGALVYARTKLQGHSGEGIVAVHNNPQTIQGAGAAFPVVNALPRASLFTKGITAQRREFRVHVFAGEVVYVQQKKRTADYQNNPNYSNVVRNYHTGWIYATNEVRPNNASLDQAKAAVLALGLNFGAVDVITRGEDAWVLEVNTAPGLQGTTLEVYADAISNFKNGVAQIRYDQRARVAQAVDVAGDDGDEEPEPIPAPLVAAMAQAVQEPVIQHQPPQRARRQPAQEQRRPLAQLAQAEMAMRDEPEEPAAVPAPVPQPAQRPARHGALEDGKFYFANVNDQRCVVQYNRGMDSFFMTGWDIAIPRAEVTEIRIAVEG